MFNEMGDKSKMINILLDCYSNGMPVEGQLRDTGLIRNCEGVGC